jgi:hypothetical protein
MRNDEFAPARNRFMVIDRGHQISSLAPLAAKATSDQFLLLINHQKLVKGISFSRLLGNR